MITFRCERCDNEMIADEDKIGKRCKCPKCGTVQKVPAQSFNAPVFSDNDAFFKSARLNELYHDFLEKHDKEILQLTLINDDTGILFEFRTGSGRSRLVCLNLVDDGNSILTFAIIGEAVVYNDLERCLRGLGRNETMFICPNCNLIMNKENKLCLRTVRRLETIIDDKELTDITIGMAYLGDFLEDVMLSEDVN